MDNPLIPTPEAPVTEAVPAGAVTAVARHQASQARWARVGLLGIGVAALIAVVALAFGSTATPRGTLAAGSQSDGNTSGVQDMHGGGPGFGPGRDGGRGFGFGGITITAISGSNLSLETQDGWTRTITVDDGTTYTKAGADVTLADLAVGDQIGFRQTRESDGSWSIDAVAVILPRVGGEVTAIDGSTITLTQRDGTTATVKVNAGTAYTVNGDSASLADVKVGMMLVAEGDQASDGTVTALRIRAGAIRDGEGRGFGPGFHGPDGDDPGATTAPAGTSSEG